MQLPCINYCIVFCTRHSAWALCCDQESGIVYIYLQIKYKVYFSLILGENWHVFLSLRSEGNSIMIFLTPNLSMTGQYLEGHVLNIK